MKKSEDEKPEKEKANNGAAPGEEAKNGYRMNDGEFKGFKRTAARLLAAGQFMETLRGLEDYDDTGTTARLCHEIGKVLSGDASYLRQVLQDMEKDEAGQEVSRG